MNPSRLFILRPVATSLLMAAILLAGLLAIRLLPIAALPEVDYPTIQVVTLYPGASADVMTSAVTAPLERQFGQMPGLNQMLSSSSGGASVITLQFSLSMGLDVAEQEVQAAINAATLYLPTDLPAPPIYNKVNPADAPIMTLAVMSQGLSLPEIEDLTDTRIAQKLSQLPGVGLVSLSGGQRPAVRIQVNETALASVGMGLEDLRSVIGAANVNMPKGGFDGPAQSSIIDANDQLKSAQEYRRLIIAYRNGAPIRLGDVARVVDGAENIHLAASANGAAAIVLNVQRQPGANVIETADRIKKMLPSLQGMLPAGTQISILVDRTTTIRASVRDVGFELLLAIALVVMVIFLFLKNLAATLIPAVAVPLSLVGTFGVMYLAGFSINNLTLMALTIATGFVVDDAIVMIENISRFREAGDGPLQAALKGSRQIGFTIISLTFSLIAVLIPLLFMSDVIGRLFREFAITLAVAILISALVSLTLTPMLCARLLRRSLNDNTNLDRPDFMHRLIAAYGRGLKVVFRHQKGVLVILAATLVLTVALYAGISKGFFPVQDTGVLQAIVDAPESISFGAMVERQQRLVSLLQSDPAVANIASVIGVDGNNPNVNSGRLVIGLKAREHRERLDEVMQHLQQRAETVPGIKLFLQPVQDISIEDRVSRTQYQFTMQGTDAVELKSWVDKLMAGLATQSYFHHLANDMQSHGLQAFLTIDRETAARLGVTPLAIDNALYDAFGQRLISTLYTQANQYRVVLEVRPGANQGLDALKSIYVAGSGGQIPLSNVVRVEQRLAPLVNSHLAQFPVVTVSFDLAPGASLDDAVESVNRQAVLIGLPANIQLEFQGAAKAFRAALSNELWLILAAIVTMYIVLGVLYESFVHPVTILSTLPSAGIGALLALMLGRQPLDVIAIIGIILLIGIVKKNAIMMIDFALEAERVHRLDAQEAIYQACLLRFRPILMTTMSALLGALPLMIGQGIGSELRHPLGITMVGGLIFSQILTLFTTPVLYLAFDRMTRRRLPVTE